MFDESFFVAVAFAAVIGIFIYLRLPQRVLQMLDDKAAEIKGELDAARGLREDAAALLADYQARGEAVEKQGEEIIAEAVQTAKHTAAEARTAMQAQLDRRAVQADQRIARAEDELVKEIRAAITGLAIAAVARLVESGLSAAQAQQLIEANIAEISSDFQANHPHK